MELPSAYYETYSVQRVIDGDTFVRSDGKRIRLWGYNTPERGKPYFGTAKQMFQFHAGVRVRCRQMDVDRYDRIVARCKTMSGRDIGSIMVHYGLARDYTRYSKGEYLDEERSARRREIGLWSSESAP